jgi:3-methyladenine DNA glycosylase AlkD
VGENSFMNGTKLQDLIKELKSAADPAKAKILQRFFKTGKGQYGEGDVFIGVNVPGMRKIAKKYSMLKKNEVLQLLKSKIHEERLVAVLILVSWFEKGDENTKEDIYKLYLDNTEYINNWDLVDLSASKIVGAFLFDKSRGILYRLAESDSLWERRISIISTFYFIRKGQCEDTIKISKLLLNDEHDLIHKAVGWMLREVGKNCSEKTLTGFLKKHYKRMPRTMLRYSIEKYPVHVRKKYLEGLI